MNILTVNLVLSTLVFWVAARIYSAGVLMYGQKPGIHAMWKALRQTS